MFFFFISILHRSKTLLNTFINMGNRARAQLFAIGSRLHSNNQFSVYFMKIKFITEKKPFRIFTWLQFNLQIDFFFFLHFSRLNPYIFAVFLWKLDWDSFTLRCWTRKGNEKKVSILRLFMIQAKINTPKTQTLKITLNMISSHYQ